MNLTQDVFNWLDVGGAVHGDDTFVPLAFDLVKEEVQELKEAITEGNKQEVMDAVADIFWVTMNVAYFYGISAEEMTEYFDKVSESNWSKYTTDEQVAIATVEAYNSGTHPDKPGVIIPTTYTKEGVWYVIRNAETGKILKSINYKKP